MTPGHNQPNKLLVPVGVTYDSILTDSNALISIENLLLLLRSVSPKLNEVYEKVELKMIEECLELKGMFLKLRGTGSVDLLEGISDAESSLEETYYECKALLDTIKSTLPELQATSSKTAEKLEAHISINGEMNLLRLLIEHSDFVDTIFEFFRQVDEYEAKTVQGFEKVSESRLLLKNRVETMIQDMNKQLSKAEDEFVDSRKIPMDSMILDISPGELDTIMESIDSIREYL